MNHGALGELRRQLQQTQAHFSRRGLPDGWRYCCDEDFVLAHGQAWTPAPLPAGVGAGDPSVCFLNAYRLMSTVPGLRYVEGFADPGLGFGVAHAWCADEHDQVVDPTWLSPGAEPAAGCAYLGVAFEAAQVLTAAQLTRASGMLANPQVRRMLLRGEQLGETAA